jgi:hypothetical protein
VRPFRAEIITRGVLMTLGLWAAIACGVRAVSAEPTAKPERAAPPEGAAHRDYYPLAVGNSWRYRCALEGRLKYFKTVKITGIVHTGGTQYFKREQTGTGQTVVSYLSVGPAGKITKSIAADGSSPEIVAARSMEIGDSFGDRHITRTETIDTPATGHVSALVLENFFPDDPQLSEDRRLEWVGTFFVAGVGIAAEGDGAGADCALTEFHLEKAATFAQPTAGRGTGPST